MKRWLRAGLGWIALIVGAGLIDWGLVRGHQPTLSEAVRHWARSWWVKAAVIALMAVLTWHLIAPEPDPVPAAIVCDEEG